MAGSNIKGITIEIDGNTSKLSTALRDVNRQARDTNNALKDIQKSIDMDPKNKTQLLSQKHRELGNAIKNTKDKLEILKQAQGQMTDEFKSTDEGKRAYDNLTREILATENQLKSLESQAKKSNEVIKSISDTSMKISEATGKAGESLTKKLTVPLIGAGTIATKTAADFDSAMVGVRKTVDMSDSEFQQMGQSIRDMSKEMPASAVEIANVAESAGQLGIKKEDVLSFTKTMIDLGISTNLTADQAATAFAKFGNITQMPADEFDNLGSVVVELGNNLATTEADIVEMGTRLAAAGSQAGLTNSDIMGLAGAMSSVGINAEAGGSSMTQVLTKIGESVSIQDEKLQTFAQTAGMSADEFTSKWQSSPREALEAFITGLGKAGESGENVDLILSELGITGVRETDTLKRLAGSGDLLHESFTMASDAFEENNALAEEAGKKYESFGGKVETFKNKLKDVGITIGETLMPHIEDGIEKIGDFADKISELDPNTISAGVAFAGFLAILGPLLLIISKVTAVIGTVSGALGIMNGVITTGTPMMMGLAKVFAGIVKVAGLVKSGFLAITGVLGGPLTIAIGAAIALIILMITHWEETKEIVGNVVDFISEKWQAFTEWFGNVWEGVKEKWSEIWDGLGEWFVEKWTVITETLQPYLEVFKNIFEVLWLAIQEIFTTAWDLISGILINFWTYISDSALLIWEGIKNLFLMIWDPIYNKITEIWGTISTFLDGIWNGIKDIAETVFGAIKDKISEIWDRITTFTSDKWEAIKGIINPIWEVLKNTAKDKFDAIKTTVSDKWEAIKSKTSSIWDTIKSKTNSVWNNVKSYIETPINNARNTVSTVVEKIQSKLSNTWDSIKNTASTIWEGIKSAITGPIEKARDAVSRAIERIKSVLDISLPTPRLKLPHPSISGHFSLNPPSVPHFSIDWYKKGAIFTKPTLFNTPGGLKGVGEAGAEAVLPIEKLDGIVANALKQNGVQGGEIVITGNTFNVRDDGDIEKIAEELYKLIRTKKRARGVV